MEEVLQDVWSSFLHVAEGIVKRLQGKTSMMEFQEQLQSELDSLGRQVIAKVAEAADKQLLNHPEERQGWVVERKGDQKTLLTTFGPVSYRRTYFRHKSTRKYRYLADEILGVNPHQRIDMALKAQMAAESTNVSYRKSGAWSSKPEWQVSGQTVMRAVRETKGTGKWNRPTQKRLVKYLFIEADEDHVASQEGKAWQPRLVYVHEGVSEKKQRRKLRNVRYFGGLYLRDLESLWTDVWRYLEETYELEDVAAILVSGDGASWIRQACEYIPGSVFVLDRYHAQKYVTAAAGQDKKLQGSMWNALISGEQNRVKRALDEAASQAETESRRTAVKDAQSYFRKNWDGILAWKTFADVWPGCSAEGHVSHIYSARLSSRPMAWTKAGVEKMARLRVLEANGESVEAAYLQGSSKQVLSISDKGLNHALQKIRHSTSLADMAINNMPALKGPSSFLRTTLRLLANAS